MNNITKVSLITVADVADYLRITELTQADINTLKSLIGIAKSYIQSYTGRTAAELDNYQDFVIVVLVLCQDMWDNRTLYVDKSNINRVVESILDLHSTNLLPEVES